MNINLSVLPSALLLVILLGLSSSVRQLHAQAMEAAEVEAYLFDLTDVRFERSDFSLRASQERGI